MRVIGVMFVLKKGYLTGEEKSDYECYLVGKEISEDLKKKIKHRSNKFKIKTFNDLIEDVEKRYSDFRS